MRRPPIGELTPEARLAAVVDNLINDMIKEVGHGPDFADFRDALAPWIAREILLGRMAEAKTCGRADRVKELNYFLNPQAPLK